MKKPLLWIITSAATGIALFLGAIWYISFIDDRKKGEEAAATDGNSPYESQEKELNEQTGFIGGIERTIQKDSIDSHSAALEILHKMTHQKVKAKDKWGAIPMTKENVLAAKEQISQLNIKDKTELLEILDRWEKEDFSQIDEDHNYFWKNQAGTIGKAYGIMTEEEEKAFIKSNFRDHLETE
ncbi:DUF6241 domain-containing protein [Pradoshia sp.]